MSNHPNRFVGAHTLKKLRGLYRDRWSLDWPEADDYLRELWGEARQAVPGGSHKVPPDGVWEFALTLMRECHTFPQPN